MKINGMEISGNYVKVCDKDGGTLGYVIPEDEGRGMTIDAVLRNMGLDPDLTYYRFVEKRPEDMPLERNGFDFYVVVRLLRTPAYDNESLDYWAYRDYDEAMGKYHEELGNCWKMFDATPDGMVMDSSNFKEWRDGDGNGFVIYCAGEEFCDSKGKKRHEEND